MIIEHKVTLVGGTYKASVTLIELTDTEKERLARFPEPLIQCGGSIPIGESSFTVPEETRRFPSQFPITKGWAFTETDAGNRANAWSLEVEARIVAAVTTLVETSPGPIGRHQTTYNLV